MEPAEIGRKEDIRWPGLWPRKLRFTGWRLCGVMLFLTVAATLVLLIHFKGWFRTGEYRRSLHEFRENTVFHTGDLLFRRGSSFESMMVMMADREGDYSHVGVVVMEGSTPWVIHTEPGKKQSPDAVVRRERMEQFLAPRKATQYSLFRMSFPEPLDTGALVHYLTEVFDAAVPFDYDFDDDDDTRLYCSELVKNAFDCAGIDLLFGKKDQLSVFGIKISVILPSTLIGHHPFTRVGGYPRRGSSN
jgi:hypothetical protein